VVDGDKLRINILIKGFGSENASVVKNLLPTVSREELINEIIEHIKLFGPNACPPLIVGIGIGGTLEKAAILSKKALLRPIGKHNDDPFWASLEDELLEKINNLNIGWRAWGKNYSFSGKYRELSCSYCRIYSCNKSPMLCGKAWVG